ncbi:hypothetical protein P4C99_05165 [Pontiellaceae bacterium B1224]|nr:hypothetical protein [Pontiellaceae bacterium B1224]
MQDQTSRGVSPFNNSRDYNFNDDGLTMLGSSVDFDSGMRLHEFNFLSECVSQIPVVLPGNVIWAGTILNGSISVQLPDLGIQTINAGNWFLARTEGIKMLNEKNSFSRVLSFSFCGCVMKRLIALADQSLQENLAHFHSEEQLLPALLQGPCDATLTMLSQSLQINDCKTLDDKLQVEYRTRNWMRTLFQQQDFSQAPPQSFGAPILR